jgi:hypothetical protein
VCPFLGAALPRTDFAVSRSLLDIATITVG